MTRAKWKPWVGGVWVACWFGALAQTQAQAQDDSTSADTEPPAAGDSEAAASVETSPEAVEHFQRGVDYYTDGDYRAALIELQRAYALQPTYKLLYNLGQVANELRDYAGAERYFRAYLREGGAEVAGDRRTEIEAELGRLRTRVATVHLQSNQQGAEYRVDDQLVAPKQGAVRVSTGQRRFSAEKQGFEPVRHVVDVAGGDEMNVRLDFEAVQLSATGARRSTTEDSTVLPWVTGIASGVVGVAAGAMGYWAVRDASARDAQLRQYTTNAELDHLSSQVHTKALVADVLLGVALAGAVVTTILVLSRGSGEPAAHANSRHEPVARRIAPTAF